VRQSLVSVIDGNHMSDDSQDLRLQIRRVDPISFAAEASEILKCAWRPPCIDYTPEYLRFQCGFPTRLDPVALAAYQGDEALGFVAATGRNSNIGDIYHSSFLSFRPGSLSSLPLVLLRSEIKTIQKSGRPVLLFAEVGSIGQSLLKCIESIGMKQVSLGEYRIHAAVPKSAALSMRVKQVPMAEWARDAQRMSDDSLLSPVFDSANLQHFVKDPGGRKFLSVIAGGKVIAVAMQGYTPTVTATGNSQIPALHYVRLGEQRAEALMALLEFAKDASNPVVTVPNVAGISQNIARAAGLRATGSAFAAYLHPNDNNLPPFRGTDFEIV
jgi:hypothetical protein